MNIRLDGIYGEELFLKIESIEAVSRDCYTNHYNIYTTNHMFVVKENKALKNFYESLKKTVDKS